MHRFVLTGLLVGAACASKKTTDHCQEVVDKSMKVLSDLATMRGAKLGVAEKKQLVAQCRKAVKAGKPDSQMECVLAAKDDAGVSACYTKGYEQYLARSKEIEAKLQLGILSKNARSAFDKTSAFPTGKVGPTPASPCCAEQIKQCVPTDTTWSDPVWQALAFRVEGAFHFQYSYESDGKTFTATATGDVTCSGKPTTSTVTGKVGSDGLPVISKP